MEGRRGEQGRAGYGREGQLHGSGPDSPFLAGTILALINGHMTGQRDQIRTQGSSNCKPASWALTAHKMNKFMSCTRHTFEDCMMYDASQAMSKVMQ